MESRGVGGSYVSEQPGVTIDPPFPSVPPFLSVKIEVFLRTVRAPFRLLPGLQFLDRRPNDVEPRLPDQVVRRVGGPGASGLWVIPE